MYKKGDLVRVIDGTDVIEGTVSSVFNTNSTDYVQVGTKVYTFAEVTRVPSSATIDPEAKDGVEYGIHAPATEKYDADKDNRDEYVIELAKDSHDGEHEPLPKDGAIDFAIKALHEAIVLLEYAKGAKDVE